MSAKRSSAAGDPGHLRDQPRRPGCRPEYRDACSASERTGRKVRRGQGRAGQNPLRGGLKDTHSGVTAARRCCATTCAAPQDPREAERRWTAAGVRWVEARGGRGLDYPAAPLRGQEGGWTPPRTLAAAAVRRLSEAPAAPGTRNRLGPRSANVLALEQPGGSPPTRSGRPVYVTAAAVPPPDWRDSTARLVADLPLERTSTANEGRRKPEPAPCHLGRKEWPRKAAVREMAARTQEPEPGPGGRRGPPGRHRRCP